MHGWDSRTVGVNWPVLVALLIQVGEEVDHLPYSTWNGITIPSTTPADPLSKEWVVCLGGLLSPWRQEQFRSPLRNSAVLVALPEIAHTASWRTTSGWLSSCVAVIRSLLGGIRRGTSTSISRSTGYHPCAFHTGATRTSSACCRRVWASTLPIRFHGGLANALSSAQSKVNASVAIAIGSGLQLTNCLSWQVNLLANRSTSRGPSLWLICRKTVGHSFQSLWSFITRDSLSAMVFNTPARCWALRRMLLSIHHSHSSLARVFSCGEIVPPSLLMYVLRWMVRFVLSFAKHFTDRKAARSSRQLMCMVLSSGVQGPPVRTPLHTAPHPFFEASVSMVREELWAIRLRPFHWVKWSPGIRLPVKGPVLIWGDLSQTPGSPAGTPLLSHGL